MSQRENVNQSTAPAGRESVRVRVEKLKVSRRRSLLGLPEIIGLSVSGLLLLLVLLVYFFSLSPARARLESLSDERNRLQRQLRISQEGFNAKTDTQTTVANINESLQRFESERLTDRSAGRMALYTQLNELIRRNGVRNTAGPNYVALLPLGQDEKDGAGGGARQKSGNARWQTIYPGIGVNLTVEGQYQNLRRFLRDIELSKQFIIINAVELESIKDSEASPIAGVPPAPPMTRGTGRTPSSSVAGPAAGLAGGPTTGGRGTLVSLRLDMAIYFKRGAEPETAPLPASQTH